MISQNSVPPDTQFPSQRDRIFMCSVGDLSHELVSDAFLRLVDFRPAVKPERNHKIHESFAGRSSFLLVVLEHYGILSGFIPIRSPCRVQLI